MIERVYLDNFRVFVNCEIKLQSVALLLGPNGGGKSSLFDALAALKRFVGGSGVAAECFPPPELTRWQTLDQQTFELDVRGDHGLFRYALQLDHERDRRRCKTVREVLSLDGRPLFEFQDGQLQLYNDRFDRGPAWAFDWSRSGLAIVESRHDNTLLTEFKDRLRNLLVLRPCPPLMNSDSADEADDLSLVGDNFASWYRFLIRQDLSRQIDVLRELRQAIEGFDSLKLEGPADATATLRATFRPAGAKTPLSFKFHELSDGQRQLILLYTVLLGVANDRRILLLDEPDNFVALPEIEPWLTLLMDAAGQTLAQAIVISHHPEVIDHLAREKGIWFTRDGAGPARIATGMAHDTAPLKPSEVEARGW